MNAPQQSGYILFIMIALLAGFGSLFLYSTLNQSGQSQKHQANIDNIKQMNENLRLIKNRLIAFGNNANSLCDSSLTDVIALPTQELFENEDFSVLSDQIKVAKAVTYEVLLNPLSLPTPIDCSAQPEAEDAYNICHNVSDEIVARLTSPENQNLGTPTITLDIKRADYKTCPTPP
ncbi:MAG: hypothetical protein AB7D03_05585 [Thiomicrospira sp.]